MSLLKITRDEFLDALDLVASGKDGFVQIAKYSKLAAHSSIRKYIDNALISIINKIKNKGWLVYLADLLQNPNSRIPVKIRH